jgi:sugar phosphate isomerase/epimerase
VIIDRDPARMISLSVGTLGDIGFAERVEAAAAAGFDGIGLSPRVVRRAHEAGLTWVAMRRLLESAGLRVVELDSILGWAVGDPDTVRRHCEQLFAIADELGGDHLLACSEVPDPDAPEVADRLAGLCAVAARRDVRIAVEPLPWVSINTVARAEELVRRSGASNAGVAVDIWHLIRAGGTPQQLSRIDPDLVLGVQLSAPALQVGADPIVETLHHRLLPGDAGSTDVMPVVRALLEAGVKAPWSVEVFSDSLRELPPAEAALAAATSTRRTLAHATTTQEPDPRGPQHL